MTEIKGRFKLKNDQIEYTYAYTGDRLQKNNVKGVEFWNIAIVDCVKAGVANVEVPIMDSHRKMP